MRAQVTVLGTVTWAFAVAGCGAPGPRNLARALQDEDPAVRIAACVAAARARDRSLLPLLVDRLDDPAADVRLFAITALRKITGRDFGYRHHAGPDERLEAIRRWRNWLARRRGRSG